MKKIWTIIDLITMKLRISLTWRKSRLTQKKQSRRKKRREKRKKIRDRRFFVLRRSRRSRKLRLQIASASEIRFLTKRKMKMTFLRSLVIVKKVKIVWECRLCSFSFPFVLVLFIQIEFHFIQIQSDLAFVL